MAKKWEKRAEKLLRENLEKVHLLAKNLLEFETLSDMDLDKILAGELLDRSKFQPEDPDPQNGRFQVEDSDENNTEGSPQDTQIPGEEKPDSDE